MRKKRTLCRRYMASMEIEKTKAYQDTYNLGKNIS